MMIDFKIVVYSIIIFLFFFIIHILLWRSFKPKKHIFLIILLFIFMPSILLLIFFFVNLFINIISLNDIILIYILYIGISGVYIQTYPAIQAWSPSLYIVYLIGCNKKPVNKDQIKKIISRDILIDERIDDLINEELIMISKNDNSIILLKRGKILSDFFIFYRKLLGLKEGQG